MLIDFLADVVIHMELFREDIQTAYVFEERPKQVIATGNHPKRMLFYRAVSDTDLTDEIVAPAYIGALPYLRKILTTSLMKDQPRLEIKYREKNDKPFAVSEMHFFSERFDSKFQCTNPDILNDKDRAKKGFSGFPDAVFFPVSKALFKEFDEVSKFGTPKADLRLFTLDFDGKMMRAQFGGSSHNSNLKMTDNVTGATGTKFSKLVALDRFRMMLKLASENDNGKAAFHQEAVWVDFNTKHALHTVASPTIREQVR